ncbi:hypothetical protein AGMMS50262_12700 [Bacteroidia bacterium]|nr:hypothetical protein AGMMS50262_12700 [Bacteroidia bacterium]
MSEVTAQTYYYSTTKTFNESGYTYQCDIKYGGVVLYNKANQYTYKNQTYKDGSYLDIDWAEVDDVQNETWTKPMAWDIVNKAFTTTEKKRFKDEALGITMIINPETGKVIEVSFDFMPKSGYATVAVSTYRKIETELKNKIWFTPTTEGKKANYLMRFWMQKVE